MDLNLRLFRMINGGPESIAPVMHFFSEAANAHWFRLVVGLLVLTMAFRGLKTRTTAIEALIAFPLADAATNIIKHVLPEYRPYQELSGVVNHVVGNPSTFVPNIHHITDFGTASAHSANMAAIAFVFCYHLKWWGAIWVGIALTVGYSRIYLASHYPYQVLFGWTVGMFAGLLVTKTWDLWLRRKPEEERTLEADASE